MIPGARGKSLKAIFDSLNDAFLIADPDYTILYANKALIELSGKKEEEVIGRTCYQALHNRDTPCPHTPESPCTFKMLEEKLKKGDTSPVRAIHKHTLSEGGGYYVDISATPLQVSASTYYIQVARDVTTQVLLQREREKHLEELKRQSETLKQKNRLIETYSNLLGHDLKNRMSIIQGYTELLDTPRREEYLKRIQKAVKDSLQMIEDTNRILKTLEKEAIHTLNLAPLISRSIKKALKHHPNLEIEYTPSHTLVNANSMLESVFDNLLANAAQHNPDQKVKVEIQVKETKETVEIEVRDNGRGIDPEIKIFQPGARHPKTGGSGFGLHFTRKLLEIYGGEIQLIKGEGAAFKITLPTRETTKRTEM